MKDTTKKKVLERGSGEKGTDSLKPDRDCVTVRRDVGSISSRVVDLQGKRSKNAVLSEDFFLSDLSED